MKKKLPNLSLSIAVIMGCLLSFLQKLFSCSARKKVCKNKSNANIENILQVSSDSNIPNSSSAYFKSKSVSDLNKEVSMADLLSVNNHVNTDFYILLDEKLSKVSKFKYESVSPPQNFFNFKITII